MFSKVLFIIVFVISTVFSQCPNITPGSCYWWDKSQIQNFKSDCYGFAYEELVFTKCGTCCCSFDGIKNRNSFIEQCKMSNKCCTKNIFNTYTCYANIDGKIQSYDKLRL